MNCIFIYIICIFQPYSVTCGYSATGLDTSLITSAKCTLTLADGMTEELTITSPFTGTVTSDAKYLTGGVTAAVVEIATMDGGVTVNWMSASTAVNIGNDDVTTTPTVINQGVSISNAQVLTEEIFQKKIVMVK